MPSRNYRQSFVTIRGHGTFRQRSTRWSSDQSRVTFHKVVRRGELWAVCGKVWGQKAKGSTDEDGFVTPKFTDEEFERMRQNAISIFQDRENGVPHTRNPNKLPDKNHIEELCERCEALGKNCTGSK